MITVKLKGGLGNQMFQYAMGRSLAIDKNEKLVLDAAEYDMIQLHEKPYRRRYELYYFGIPDLRKKGIFAKYLLPYYNLIRCEIYNRFQALMPSSYIREKDISHREREREREREKNIYLDGYWQSEKYFHHNAEIIKKDFTMTMPQNEINQHWSEIIANTNSICLHVRRGDYVTTDYAHLGTLIGENGITYYKDAINHINSQIENPVYFIFSDDMQWVKEHINIPDKTVYYMDHNDITENYEDLRLMMECKHFIIANSTFSWWAAYLGKFTDKIVIAPKKWLQNNDTDIILDSWIKL